jgi:hypothetical protein
MMIARIRICQKLKEPMVNSACQGRLGPRSNPI